MTTELGRRRGLVAASCFVLIAVGPSGPARPAGSAAPWPDPGGRTLLAAEGVPYADGRLLDVYRPVATPGRPPPVVVMLHACCGDRSDLVKLAEATAAAGAVVLNADWAGLDADARYPAAYEEAACAVRYARSAAARHGGDPTRVALLGWSDGALAAAVVALAGDRLDRGRCRAGSSARPDALIGVGGYYGWRLPVPARLVSARAVRFLGGTPATAARTWHDATPYAWLPSTGGRVRTVLLVGETDPLRADATAFAAALRRAGHPTALVVAPQAGDQSMISPRTEEGRTTVRLTVAAARGT